MLDRREVSADRIQMLAERFPVDQDAGAGIIQHVRVLLRVQPDVHGHHGHPALHGRQDGLKPLGTVREQHANAVASRRPQLGEGVGEAIDPRLRLTKRDDPLVLKPRGALRPTQGRSLPAPCGHWTRARP
jgi:hypothetical protein